MAVRALSISVMDKPCTIHGLAGGCTPPSKDRIRNTIQKQTAKTQRAYHHKTQQPTAQVADVRPCGTPCDRNTQECTSKHKNIAKIVTFPPRVPTPHGIAHLSVSHRYPCVVACRLQKSQQHKQAIAMPSTQLAVNGEVVNPNALIVQDGRSHFSFNESSIPSGGNVVSPAKRALLVPNQTLCDMVTKPPGDSLKLWMDNVTPANVLILGSPENDPPCAYPYAIFDVEGFPEQKRKPVAIPIAVAERVMAEVYKRAADEPDKYGLKLNDQNQTTRERAQARLDACKWTSAQCVRADKDGNLKPCMLKPRTTTGFVLEAAKTVPKASYADLVAPKQPRVNGKRILPGDMAIASHPVAGVARIISFKKTRPGSTFHTHIEEDTIVVTEFAREEELVAPAVSGGETAEVRHVGDDDDDEE
jgi:hypothetical protein